MKDKSMQIQVSICNFNTTCLTNNCIRSVLSMLDGLDFKIVVLDNSDVMPFSIDDSLKTCGLIDVIDNTSRQVVSIDDVIQQKQYKVEDRNVMKNYASIMHACSIQFLIDHCNADYMLLLDSDVILRRSLNRLFLDNDDCITVADIQGLDGFDNVRISRPYWGKTRFIPFI